MKKIAIVIAMVLASGPAFAQVKLGPIGQRIANDVGGGASGGGALNNILGALDEKILPDLEYALKIATASGSNVTAPCYTAWIDIIKKRQAAVVDANANALPLPNPRLITDFEKAVELRNALQPDSEFMLRCSPVANMVKQDMIKFIGMVLAGGAGLATLVPGL